MNKLPLNQLLLKFTPEHRRVAQCVIDHFHDRFWTAPGSTTKHQAWQGGYVAHLEETMNIALVLFDAFQSIRPFPFQESQALFTLFLHDCDKLFAYSTMLETTTRTLKHNKAHNLFIQMLREDWKYTLTNDEENALRYVHGENEDYHPTERIMKPLAAFIHCCDIMSARIWFGFGKSSTSWES